MTRIIYQGDSPKASTGTAVPETFSVDPAPTVQVIQEPRLSDVDVLHGVRDQVRLCAATGGLIIIGPTLSSLPGLQALLESPGVVPVKIEARRLQTWENAKAESVLLSRRISSIIRRGETPIVYLDTHLAGRGSVPIERHDFVSQRLGQIIVGLADMPSYLAIYGTSAAPLMLLEGVGRFDNATIGTMPCGLPLMQVKQGVFRDLHVTLAPATGPIARFAQLYDWFEARRVPDGPCHDLDR